VPDVGCCPLCSDPSIRGRALLCSWTSLAGYSTSCPVLIRTLWCWETLPLLPTKNSMASQPWQQNCFFIIPDVIVEQWALRSGVWLMCYLKESLWWLLCHRYHARSCTLLSYHHGVGVVYNVLLVDLTSWVVRSNSNAWFHGFWQVVYTPLRLSYLPPYSELATAVVNLQFSVNGLGWGTK